MVPHERTPMARRSFTTTTAERVALIHAGFVVRCGLGTNLIHLDLSIEEDKDQGLALLAMREAAQDDLDRVGAP